MRPPEGEPGRDTTNCLTSRVVLLFRHTLPPEYSKTRFEKSESDEFSGTDENGSAIWSDVRTLAGQVDAIAPRWPDDGRVSVSQAFNLADLYAVSDMLGRRGVSKIVANSRSESP